MTDKPKLSVLTIALTAFLGLLTVWAGALTLLICFTL
jgi:hypothetical protein